MYGHSNGYTWDNQDRSFDYRQLEIDHNRDRVRKILREFGGERKLSDMPKYTTFIGVKRDFIGNTICNILGEETIRLALSTDW